MIDQSSSMAPSTRITARVLVRSVAIWAAAFLGIFVWKSWAIFLPPYNEYAETTWTESLYLAETDYDLESLWRQPQIEEGGVRAYSISAMSWFVAALMRNVPPPLSFMLYRLAMFAAAGVIFCFIYLESCRRFGMLAALWVCVYAATLPHMSIHLEMLGIELPLTACVVIAAWLAVSRRYKTAGWVLMAAFFVKLSAAAATLALAIGMLVDLAAQPRSKRASIALALVVVVAIGCAQGLLFGWSAIGAQLVNRDTLGGMLFTVLLWWLLCPYFFLLLFALVAYAWLVPLLRSPHRWIHPLTTVRAVTATLEQLARRDFVLLFGGVLIALVLVASPLLTFAARYLVMITPFFALLLGQAIFSKPDRRRGSYAVMGGLIMVNLAATHFGSVLLLPQIPGLERAWSVPERSHEYLDDLRSTMRAAKFLDTCDTGEPVLVGKLFTHILSSPAMGYSKHRIHGYTVLDAFALGKFDHALQMLEDRPPSVLVVSVTTGEYTFPPPAADDEVLYDDHQTPPLMIYRKKFGQQTPRDTYEAWYLRMMRLNSGAYIRCSLLATSKNDFLGADYLERRFRNASASPELKAWLAQVFREHQSPVSADAMQRALEPRGLETIAPATNFRANEP